MQCLVSENAVEVLYQQGTIRLSVPVRHQPTSAPLVATVKEYTWDNGGWTNEGEVLLPVGVSVPTTPGQHILGSVQQQVAGMYVDTEEDMVMVFNRQDEFDTEADENIAVPLTVWQDIISKLQGLQPDGVYTGSQLMSILQA